MKWTSEASITLSLAKMKYTSTKVEETITAYEQTVTPQLALLGEVGVVES